MKTIAILFHEQATGDPHSYIIGHLADFWREAGLRVVYLFGTREFVPADLLFLHVDLSVVPHSYLEFADRYPRVVNRRITDIRKSTISNQLVGPDDAWSGAVIVKSNLNFGGGPERRVGRNWLERRSRTVRRLKAALERRFPSNYPSPHSKEYQLLPSLSDVPKRWFRLQDVVVERFLPEMENGLYHVRIDMALGGRSICTRLASDQPIIKAHNSTSAVDIEPDPRVQKWRKDLGLDYGKIDYTVVDGEPVLLDVNKTIGASPSYRSSEDLLTRRRHLSEGIQQYLV